MKLESRFKSETRNKIRTMFPGCYIFKPDQQGLPDMIILHGEKWAALEFKRFEDASRQPNQPYHVSNMNRMSFAAFIYPENEEEVLNELSQALRARRSSRLP